MSIANNVADIIKDAAAFSLYGAEAHVGSKRIKLPHGVQLLEKRNKEGRVIKAVYQYADDSKLTFEYSVRWNKARFFID